MCGGGTENARSVVVLTMVKQPLHIHLAHTLHYQAALPFLMILNFACPVLMLLQYMCYDSLSWGAASFVLFCVQYR